MSNARLIELRTITGHIVVMTGLRIGGSQETMEISGLDNPIIRNPANAEPFIPGSSLKGKMRSLSEWYWGELPHDGEVTKPRLNSETARVFGLPARDPRKESDPQLAAILQQGPTRLIVRDARLSDESRRTFSEGKPLTEVKSENSINRLTSLANPRPMERVLPGVKFDLEIVYRVFDLGDQGQRDRSLFDKVVLKALALVEADALGGGSSRGNGKVKFENLAWRDGAGMSHPLQLPKLAFAQEALVGA